MGECIPGLIPDFLSSWTKFWDELVFMKRAILISLILLSSVVLHAEIPLPDFPLTLKAY